MSEAETVENILKPGDVSCDELFLTTNDLTEYDFTSYMVEFNLYEDLFSPTLTGEILVTDAVNAITKWPIRGGEILTVKFRTKTLQDHPNNIIEKSFQIYAIEKRILNNDREQFYTLKFTSIEAISDQARSITQAFGAPGMLRSTHEIAEQIYLDHIQEFRRIDRKRNTTPFIIGDTPHTSKIQYTSNFWTPFQNMQFISRKCQGAEFIGSDYLFFETNKSFYLTSLQNLIKKQIDVGLWEEFSYTPPGMDVPTRGGGETFLANELPASFSKIEAISVPRTIDILDGQDSGYYSASTRAFDLFTKEQAEVTLDGRDQFSSFVHTDTGIPIPAGIQRNPYSFVNIKYLNQVMFTGMQGGLVDGKYGAAANPALLANNLFRQVYFSSFNDNKFEIDLPGRTDIEAGKLVKLVYPNAGDKPTDATYDDLIDPLLTGNYLITAIKHKIDSARHTMKVEIVKNGLAKSLGEADDNVVGAQLA
jgi:hypothetical protein